MGNTISRVDDSSRQATVLDFAAGPAGGESKDGLDGNVETGTVEGLEHDLGGVLAGFWRVQGLSSTPSAFHSPHISFQKHDIPAR